MTVNVEENMRMNRFESSDIVLRYGLLYHLENPIIAL